MLKHRMHIMVFVASIVALNAPADETVYSLDTAPWSKQNFEICKPAGKHPLRPVIFAPKYQSIEFVDETQTTVLVIVQGKTLADGTYKPASLREVIVPVEKRYTTYQYLKNQTIGYLNANNDWVNGDGHAVKSMSEFTHLKGQKEPPKNIAISNWYMPYDQTMPRRLVETLIEKVKTGPNCQYIIHTDYETAFEQYLVNAGNNNAFSCVAGGGFERHQNLNAIKTQKRRVISRPDGDRIYLKGHDGKFRITSSMTGGMQLFEEKQGVPNCEWKNVRTD